MPSFPVRGLIRLALPVGSILLLATCREEAPLAADERAPRLDLAAAAGPDILVGAGNLARCDKQNDEATAAILDTVAGTVFTAGDNVYASGSSTEYTTCYGPSWGRQRPRTRPSVGDKDYKTTGAAGYFAYFGSAAGDPARGYYSYDLTDWHVVVLNSGTSAVSTKAGSLQEQWLRADLAATAKQCILGVWHTPLFSSSGTAVKSSIKPLWDALYAAHADVVVNGHYRVYERFAPQSPTETADPGGIREFIVGTGGQGSDAFSTTIRPNSEVRRSGTYGVLKLVLGAGTYSWQFIPVAGQSFSDAGSGTCHNRILAPVASVTVTPASASVVVSATVQLTATPRDASGNALSGRTVTWASDAPGVATVDGAGLVTATAEGSATITATSEGQSGTATIAVATVPIASVEVSPASASVQVADALRLTAIPRDAAGNPLTGRVVTWSTTDATVVPVDATGLVTGARVGAAAVTATVEGLSAAAAVTVTALPPCLSRTGGGPTVVLSGVQTAPYDNTGLAAGTKVDARAAQFLTGVDKAVVLGGGAAICLSGGAAIGQLPPSTDWNTMHDTYATTSEGVPFFAIEGTTVFDYGDAITLKDSTRNWIIRGVHFKYIRDDCIQNDWVNSGTIDSSFFDGCSTGMSARPYATLDDGSGNLVLVQNSLFRLQDMDQGYQEPGHGGFFKWAEVGPQVALYNNVYRADSPSDLGGHTLGPPPGKVRDCANNVMIWLGAGPFPETLPSCFTLLTGTAGLAYWNAAVATWYANHPNALTDIAPPIVSVFAPVAGATVSAVTSLTATAVDDRDVAGVQFRLDGAAIGPEVTTESPLTKFTLSWDSRGTPDGIHALSATARDGAGHVTTSAPTTITIANGTPVPLSTVAVSPPTITASTGTSAATVTVTVKDANDQPVSGATVTIAATGSGNTITQPPAPTGSDGVAIGTLTSTAAGQKTLTVTVNGLALSQQPVVTVVAGPPDANRSTVSAAPSSIVAGGGAAAILVTVRDGFGNPVGGATVGLSASGTGNALTQPVGPTDASGMAGGSLSSSDVQTVTVTAGANGVTIAQTALVTVTSPAPPARITHTLLTSGHDPNNVKVYTTAAIAPAPGALVTVAVMTHQSSAAAPSPTLTGGGMSAWDVVGTITFDGTTPLKRITIYRALAAAPGSGPITITSSVTVSNCQWIVSQWTGVDASGVNGAGAIAQTAAAGGTAVNGLSALLAPFANANDVAYGVFGVNANVVGTVTPGSGFTKIDEQPSGESTSADLFAEWAFNLNAVNATWTAKNGGALGIEIRVSPGP